MTAIKKSTILSSGILVVSMIAIPALVLSAITPETEDLSELLLISALYVGIYAAAIGFVTGLVFLLFKGAGSICNLLAYLLRPDGQ